jgi:hypothetical protein
MHRQFTDLVHAGHFGIVSFRQKLSLASGAIGERKNDIGERIIETAGGHPMHYKFADMIGAACGVNAWSHRELIVPL